MAFFVYRQNNSGGHFVGARAVIVEADDHEQADVIALSDTDIYFDGVLEANDCPCCGDRWYPQRASGDSYATLEEATSHTYYKDPLIIRKEKVVTT